MWRLAEMSDEISREGVHTGTAARANVLFDINMHEAVKLPLIWMKKHLESGSSIKGHTHRSCQNPGVRCVCYTAQSNWCYKRRNSVFLFLFNNFNDAFPPPEDRGAPGQPQTCFYTGDHTSTVSTYLCAWIFRVLCFLHKIWISDLLVKSCVINHLQIQMLLQVPIKPSRFSSVFLFCFFF